MGNVEQRKNTGVKITVYVFVSRVIYNRYDKLYVDNEPYVWDEEEARVLPARFFPPIFQ